MTRNARPDLPQFLTGVASEWMSSDTVLLTARYDVGQFVQTLFEQSQIDLPRRVAQAVQKRQAEFLAGRLLARRGLEVLDHSVNQIGIADSRAPIWPSGVTGSLSHAKGVCAAIVSRNPTQTFGVDCEKIAEGESLRAIRSQTLSASENARTRAAYEATCVFSAKEALFKALNPQVNRFFGFEAAELVGAVEPETLTLKLTETLSPTWIGGEDVVIHHRAIALHVLTWLAVPLR